MADKRFSWRVAVPDERGVWLTNSLRGREGGGANQLIHVYRKEAGVGGEGDLRS